MNIHLIRAALDDVSREYTALQSENILSMPEQQVLTRIERMQQQLEQVGLLIADFSKMYPTEARAISIYQISADTLQSDLDILRAKFVADVKAQNMATKHSKKQANLEDNERIRTNIDVISRLENIYRILSQEAARSEDCLRALQASTDVLRSVAQGHDSIAMATVEGRRCISEIDKIERRDKRIVRSLFLAFCATALLVVRHRLKRIHLYPPFLP